MAFQALTVEERSRAKFIDFGMDGSLHEFQLHPYTMQMPSFLGNLN
jgi:hypothetical protein